MVEQQLTEKDGTKARLETEQKANSGANWFYWIAGLSVLNTLTLMAGIDGYFPVGLGITLVLGATGVQLGSGAVLFGMALSLLVAGLFVFFGVQARKGKSWAFIAGLVLYGMDGLLMLTFQDWFGVAFHVWATLGLIGGMKAANQMNEMMPTATPAAPYTQPVADLQKHDSVK